MQVISRLAKSCVLLVVFAAIAGCEDELPTIVGEDAVPGSPTTIELTLPADRFLEELGQFTDYTDPREAGFLLVANRFEGALEANTLARFTGFPAAVTYTQGGASQTDSSFVYGSGRVVARVDTAASTIAGPVTLQLWSLAQPWDPGSVTWELAIDTAGVRVPWSRPGGTLGRLLAEVVRTPGDTLTRDSVTWQLDSLAVAQIASADFPGLLVTTTSASARLQFGRLVLRTAVRPAGRPDTAIAQSVTTGPQTFIFTPALPNIAGTWEAGGLRSGRVLLRVALPQTVSTCPPGGGSTGVDCRPIPLRDVNLNDVSLLLDPLPVPDGFRPLAPVQLFLRTVGEPELGRRAPLGSRIAGVSVPARRFQAASDSAVALSLTSYLRQAAGSDTTAFAVALLAEPDLAGFGIARFRGSPRLRLVYTIPSTVGVR